MAEEKKIVGYRFVGPGQGVTGLPHEITAEQAQAWEAEAVKLEADLAKKRKGLKPDSVRQVVEQVDLNRMANTPWANFQAALARELYEAVVDEPEDDGGSTNEKKGKGA